MLRHLCTTTDQVYRTGALPNTSVLDTINTRCTEAQSSDGVCAPDLHKSRANVALHCEKHAAAQLVQLLAVYIHWQYCSTKAAA